MTAMLLTGFPGFLGSALLPRLLARREGVRAICLVQPQHMAAAQRRVREIEAAHPHTLHRVDLVEGDITAPGLGMDPAARAVLDDVAEVWHLAAVYDLAVAQGVARRVNVEGRPRHGVLPVAPAARQVCSTSARATSAGGYDGEFTEDGLDEGQGFLNHYESTKFEAEVLVRRRWRTACRRRSTDPGSSSATHAPERPRSTTAPTSWPRSCAGSFPWLWSQPSATSTASGSRWSPRLRHRGDGPLSVLDRSVGQTFALTDPNPPTVRQLVDVFASHLGKQVVWVPLPLGHHAGPCSARAGAGASAGHPGRRAGLLRLPDHATPRRTRSPTLEGTGLACPPFAELRRQTLGLHGRPSGDRLLGDDLSVTTRPDPECTNDHGVTRCP